MNFILLFIFLSIINTQLSADLWDFVSQVADGQHSLFFEATYEKDEQYKQIVKKIQERTTTLASVTQKLTLESKNVQEKITTLEKDKKEGVYYEIRNKELELYREMDQVIKDSIQTHNDILTIMYEYKKILKKFLSDSDFQEFRKENKLQKKSHFTFQDLLFLHQAMQVVDIRLTHLKDQKKNKEIELETYQRMVKSNKKIAQNLGTKLKQINQQLEQERNADLETEEPFIFLQIQVAELKEYLDRLKIEHTEYALHMINHQLFINKNQSHILKEQAQNVKYNIHVTEQEIEKAQENLSEKKEKAFSEKNLRQERERIFQEESIRKNMLDQLSLEYKIEPLHAEDWTKDIEPHATSYRHFVEIAWLCAHIRTLEISRQLIEMSLIDTDINIESLSVLVWAMETFNHLMTRRFLSEHEILENKKKYEAIKADAEVRKTLYEEKFDVLTNILSQQKKNHDLVAQFDQKLTSQKLIVFHNNNTMYEETKYFVQMALDEGKKYTETLNKLTEIYSNTIHQLENIIKLSTFSINELRSGTIWYRPSYAISWQGLQNAPLDIVLFFKGIFSYITHVNVIHLYQKLTTNTKTNFFILFLVLKILLFALLIFIYRRFALMTYRYFMIKSSYEKQALQRISLCIATFLEFSLLHLWGLILTIICFWLIYVTSDVYLLSIFYLFLIPYSIYLVRSAITLLLKRSKERGNLFLPEELSGQFEHIASFLLSTTISIMLFRQAFMLSGLILQSEIPTILLAINFILLQLSLISFVSKEHIAEMFPSGTLFWQGIRQLIDSYFYVILFFVSAVIVMSNPYIGFGRLILYLLMRAFYIVVILRTIVFLHSTVKTTSSHILFTSEGGMITERFSHAKTFFGFIIILSFICFCFFGGIIIAKVCGWPITFYDFFSFFYEPLLFIGTKNPITIISLLQIIGFILAGFIFSYALEHFVFEKIFDLLLVEVGIQHTIVRITQYIVITIAIFIGFQNVGLEKIVGYAFTALALSIGWYIKEPISDFFAYFIILVQRTIKIGDFIRIEGDIEGVVRKITPRSVILRRKNSATLLIPNTLVVKKVVANWNYIRSFVAFDDMHISIQYQEDPQLVRNLILQVLNNHPRILKTPKPIVFLNQFGEHGYTFMIRGFLSSTYTLDMWEIASEIRISILQTLREHHIKIAVPVRLVAQAPTMFNYNEAMKEEKEHGVK